MLKLNLSPEPFWLEVGGGIRVKVPPLDTAILRTVEYTAWQAYAGVKSAANDGDDTTVLDGGAVAKLEGVFALGRARALVGQIMAWEGVADEAGMPLAPCNEALDAFAAHPLAGPAFVRAYDATVRPLIAEGNGSASSLPGDGAGATVTAPDALPVEVAVVDHAQASGTPRKASKR